MILGLSFFVVPSSVTPQERIFQWIDAQGRRHYSNAPTGDTVSVDDVLPPTSSFANPLELIPPATTAIKEDEPTASDNPVAIEEETSIPVPQGSADLLEMVKP